MAYWLMRSEPGVYGWADLVRDGRTEWDGVRNHAAAIHLRAMRPGDRALFYHSNTDKAAVGVMEVTRAWAADGDDGKWASVEVRPVAPLKRPVTLAEIKAEPRLKGIEVVRQSRLSVTPVRDAEWAVLMELAEG